jgi:acyl-CoA thioesterase-1
MSHVAVLVTVGIGAALALTALAAFLSLVFKAFIKPARSGLRTDKHNGRANDKRAVVCAGDSLTHASLSGDYVAVLQQRFSELIFLNAGQNGATSWDLVKRVDDVAACNPVAITLLIGCNDVLRSNSDAVAKTLCDNIHKAILELRAKSSASIAIASLAPLGELPGDALNGRVDVCNAAIRELAQVSGVAYLPVSEALWREIVDQRREAATPFRFRVSILFKSAIQHFWRRKSFDEIAARNGYAVMSDGVHLSERGSTIVADVVGGWLNSLALRKPSASSLSSPSTLFVRRDGLEVAVARGNTPASRG